MEKKKKEIANEAVAKDKVRNDKAKSDEIRNSKAKSDKVKSESIEKPTKRPRKANGVCAKIKSALGNVIAGGAAYKVLLVSLFVNFLVIDYVILTQSTTYRILFAQNTDFYNYASIGLSIVTAILFSIAMTMLAYIFANRKKDLKESAPSGVVGTIFGAVASGCPVCGAWLLPILGIAGSLAVFPFQGLEIKVLAIILLALSVIQSSNVIAGVCDKKGAERRMITGFLIIIAFIAALFVLPSVSPEYKTKFQRTGVSAPTVAQIELEKNVEKLYDQVNPKEGFELNVKYGNIGYQMVKDGAIDFDKFKGVYDRAGSSLTEEQLQIFTEGGLDKKIVIDRDNSYFLLNLFWAFGLANENPILTEGEIVKYGKGKVGNFASTGGWTIAKKPLAEFMAKSKLASLTEEQQARLQKVAENVYRPCCGNSTAFPDCNHGMALLGVLELLASQDASEDEMFEAAKYFSAFWFPAQALDVATFFMINEGTDFAQLDGRTFVSRDYFSGQGWSRVKGWLQKNASGAQQAPTGGGGGGCGVESGAPAATTQQRAGAQVAPQGGGGCGV